MRRRRTGSETEPPGAEASVEIAARFLGTRPRSRWEVERRLRRAGASDQIIEGTLDHLAGLGLVDDLAFARWWVEQRDRHAPRGRRLVEAELREHGVGRDVIEMLRDDLAALETRAHDSSGEGKTWSCRSARQSARGSPWSSTFAAARYLGIAGRSRGWACS